MTQKWSNELKGGGKKLTSPPILLKGTRWNRLKETKKIIAGGAENGIG